MKRCFQLFAVVAVLIAPGLVSADPIDATNDRDPAIAIGGCCEPNLQSILDGAWGVGTVDAATDQQSAGMWGSTSTPATIVTGMIRVEHSGVEHLNQLGIFGGTDTASLNEYILFSGAASDGAYADVKWTSVNSGTIKSYDAFDNLVNSQTFTGISFNFFGFYLLNPSNQKWYTVDQLNGGVAATLAYNKPSTSEWMIGFDDFPVGGDHDYQDLVLQVHSLQAPEPSTLVLLGAGLAGLSLLRRRKR